MDKNGEKLKEAGRTATAVVTSASLLLSGVFHDSAEAPTHEGDAPHVAIVEMLSPDTDPGDDGDASETEEEDKRSPRAKARQRWLRLPAVLRTLGAAPAWALGLVALAALPVLWKGVLPAVLQTVLFWVIAAGVLLGVLAATVKTVFPDLPVKKLLTRKPVKTLLFGALTMGMLEGVMLWRFPRTGNASAWLHLGGSMALLGGVTALVLRRESKRRKKQAEKEAEEAAKEAERKKAEAEKKAAELREKREKQMILELADSVSRKD